MNKWPRGLTRWGCLFERASDGTGLIGSMQVIGLPFTARLARTADARPGPAPGGSGVGILSRIKNLAERAAAADGP
jgi:hypothetical protein